MRLDEIERTRVFLRFVFALCVGGIIVALITGGDAIAQVVVIVGSRRSPRSARSSRMLLAARRGELRRRAS